MDDETRRIQALFDEAILIKEQRGKAYGNNGDSAYSKAIDLMGAVAGIWPIVQKTMRLIEIAKEPNFEWTQASAFHDTAIDLIDYVGMFYAHFAKEIDGSNADEKDDISNGK